MQVLMVAVVALTLQSHPDFSGSWEFDAPKSMKPAADGRIVMAPMLGESVMVEQDAKTLTFIIKTGGRTVKARYRVDGTETRNMSPGVSGEPDIAVTSRAAWDDGKLVIDSKSLVIERGVAVTVETRRVLTLDDNGDLIIERSGSPASLVTPSRSVYRKVQSRR